MADVEHLHFKIGLAGTYWDKQPQYSILLNDTLVQSGYIESPADEITYIEFDTEIAEGPAVLKIRLDNKEDSDVLKDDYTSTDFIILKDLLLNIKNIQINNVDLGNIIRKNSKFVSDNGACPVLTNCVDLGWNGTWELEFESPFYIWLLENI